MSKEQPSRKHRLREVREGKRLRGRQIQIIPEEVSFYGIDLGREDRMALLAVERTMDQLVMLESRRLSRISPVLRLDSITGMFLPTEPPPAPNPEVVSQIEFLGNVIRQHRARGQMPMRPLPMPPPTSIPIWYDPTFRTEMDAHHIDGDFSRALRLPNPHTKFRFYPSRIASMQGDQNFRERLMKANPKLACAVRFYEDRRWIGGGASLVSSMSAGHIRTRWPSIRSYAIVHDSEEATGTLEEITEYRKWWIAQLGRGWALGTYSAHSPGVAHEESFTTGRGYIIPETERMFTVLKDELEELYG